MTFIYWEHHTLAVLNFLPEIFFSFILLIQMVFNVYLRKNKINEFNPLHVTIFIQTVFIFIILTLLFINCSLDYSFNDNVFYNNNQTYFLKIIISIFSLLAIGSIFKGFQLQKLNLIEFYTLFLFSVLASFLMISSGNFISLYLLIEMQSLCFYLLAAFKRNSLFCVDAGLKYFIFGSIISCIMLFSISLLYGALGTTNFQDLRVILFDFPLNEKIFTNLNTIIIISLLLILISILFKLGVAPFHFWVPDVYEGSPISSTIIFSYLPKIVFLDLLIKFLFIFSNVFKEMSILFLITGISSILIGSFFALSQNRVKRFLIYSSISQIGFPIIILSIQNEESLVVIYFFILLYTLNTIFMWNVYIFLLDFSKNSNVLEKKNSSLYLSDLQNSFFFDKTWTFFLIFAFFSSAGIPPLAGFFMKFEIIQSLIINTNYYFSIFLLFTGSLSTFYYVKIIKIIFFEKKLIIDKNTIFFVFKNDIFSKVIYFVSVVVIITLIFSFLILDVWLILNQFILSSFL